MLGGAKKRTKNAVGPWRERLNESSIPGKRIWEADTKPKREPFMKFRGNRLLRFGTKKELGSNFLIERTNRKTAEEIYEVMQILFVA